jgi:hypothetical protein
MNEIEKEIEEVEKSLRQNSLEDLFELLDGDSIKKLEAEAKECGWQNDGEKRYVINYNGVEAYVKDHTLPIALNSYWTIVKCMMARQYASSSRHLEAYALLGNALEMFNKSSISEQYATLVYATIAKTSLSIAKQQKQMAEKFLEIAKAALQSFMQKKTAQQFNSDQPEWWMVELMK